MCLIFKMIFLKIMEKYIFFKKNLQYEIYFLKPILKDKDKFLKIIVFFFPYYMLFLGRKFKYF